VSGNARSARRWITDDNLWRVTRRAGGKSYHRNHRTRRGPVQSIGWFSARNRASAERAICGGNILHDMPILFKTDTVDSKAAAIPEDEIFAAARILGALAILDWNIEERQAPE
jgi:hypothetical protein